MVLPWAAVVVDLSSCWFLCPKLTLWRKTPRTTLTHCMYVRWPQQGQDVGGQWCTGSWVYQILPLCTATLAVPTSGLQLPGLSAIAWAMVHLGFCFAFFWDRGISCSSDWLQAPHFAFVTNDDFELLLLLTGHGEGTAQLLCLLLERVMQICRGIIQNKCHMLPHTPRHVSISNSVCELEKC